VIERWNRPDNDQPSKPWHIRGVHDSGGSTGPAALLAPLTGDTDWSRDVHIKPPSGGAASMPIHVPALDRSSPAYHFYCPLPNRSIIAQAPSHAYVYLKHCHFALASLPILVAVVSCLPLPPATSRPRLCANGETQPRSVGRARPPHSCYIRHVDCGPAVVTITHVDSTFLPTTVAVLQNLASAALHIRAAYARIAASEAPVSTSIQLSLAHLLQLSFVLLHLRNAVVLTRAARRRDQLRTSLMSTFARLSS
jgi:hypothetical protein